MYSLKFLFGVFLQADIYQPACPSNSTLFADASPRLFAHSVMPQPPLSFYLIECIFVVTKGKQAETQALRSEQSMLVRQ